MNRDSDYYTLERNGVKIGFYPNTTNPMALEEKALPDVIVGEYLEIDSAFEDELPKGLALARELKLKIDLAKFSTVEEKAIRDVILEQMSSSQITITSESFSLTIDMPNIWTITKGGKTYYFVQNFTPEDKFKHGKNGSIIYDISLIELHKFIFERLKLDSEDLKTFLLTTAVSKSEYYDTHYIYSNLGKNITVDLVHSTNADLKFNYWSDFLNYFRTAYDLFVSRRFGVSYNFTLDNPFKYIKLYKHAAVPLRTNPAGNLLNLEMILSYAIFENKVVDGALSEKWWGGTYGTFWDLYKMLCQQCGVKAVFKPIDELNSKLEVSTILSSETPIELTLNDVLENDVVKDDLELTRNYKVISKVIGHVKDAQNNEFNEFIYRSDGTLNDASEEFELLLHSNRCEINSKITASADGSNIYIGTNEPRINPCRFFYYDTDTGNNMVKIHDRIEVFFDNSQLSQVPTIPNSDYNYPYATDPYTGKVYSDFDVKWFDYTRVYFKGTLPYLMGKYYSNIFSNRNAGFIELEVNSDLITHNDLGRAVTLDLTQLNEMYSFLKVKALIVGINESKTTKVKLFIRSDNIEV